MKKVFFLLMTLLISVFSVKGQSPYKQSPSKEGDLKQAEHFMQSQKQGFEENKGQVTGEDSDRVKYTYKDKGLSIFLLDNGIAYQFSKIHYPNGYKQLDKFAEPEEQEKMEALSKDIRVETYRMDVTLIGANENPTISTEGKSTDYTQYYNHNALNVHNYSKITYHEVYPNIDWVIYSKEGKNIKYDFVVHPGGDPNQIKLQTNWVEDLNLNEDGSLTLENRMGSITEQTPVSFQGDRTLSTKFTVENNQISFNVDDYSASESLIIDPNLEWGTYYGGGGFDTGSSCAVDGSGNVYLAGRTNSTLSIASGGHQNTYGGNLDAFLVKFNSSGVRQWATYYGGTDSDRAYSCAVDGSDNVYLAGNTNSTSSIASGGHQNTFAGGYWGDAFLVKFNSSGVRQWATYYGGTDSDRSWSCAVDGSGNVYLVGYTESTANIASGGHQNTYGGGTYDAFLVKFNSSGVRQWATYYGGSDYDYGESCAVDGSGNVYLAGYTESTTNIASGGHQNTIGAGAGADAFLVKFNASGVRQWATYYGGSDYDIGESCAVDGSGNVYLAGSTGSTTNIASGGHQNTYGGGTYDAFLVKFNASGVRQWATYYGGSDSDIGESCAVDGSGNVYLAGRTRSTTNIASGGHQNTYGGGVRDAFLVKFDASGVRQWGTYYGGGGQDTGRSCATYGSGSVYLVGQTKSNSSIASGGHQNTRGGDDDAFLVKFSCTSSSTDFQTSCDSYTWIDGNTYTASNNTATQTLTNAAGCDSIVTLDLTINNSTTGTDTQTACGSYTWIDGNTYTASNNTATHILTNAAGCDSIVTLDLTINNPNVSVMNNSPELISNATPATYQWVNCEDNYAPIVGEAGPSFTASENGSYAVIVTENGCTDTSACEIVANVGLNELNSEHLKLFPNPTIGKVSISHSSIIKSIRVIDPTGRIIKDDNYDQHEVDIDLGAYSTGVYTLEILTSGGVIQRKLIKK